MRKGIDSWDIKGKVFKKVQIMMPTPRAIKKIDLSEFLSKWNIWRFRWFSLVENYTNE